jgi:hypothetical protein
MRRECATVWCPGSGDQRSYVTGRGFIGVPDVMLHVDTVKAVIAFPAPMGLEHSPRSICDDLPDTDAFVPQSARKLVLILVRVVVMMAMAATLATLPHGYGFWFRNRWSGGWRLFRRRWHYRLMGGRHRLFQRYDSITSNWLSNLSHG